MTKTDTVASWQANTKQEQASQWVTGLDEQLKAATHVRDVPWQPEQGRLQTSLTPNSFWLIYSFPTTGKLAIRTCFDPQTIQSIKVYKKPNQLSNTILKGH
jgi:hypothetical protein